MSHLKDGVMQRGSTWSFVIRVVDPETGRSRPRWVGGFTTEKEAKSARDDARVKARRREYVDRSRITVGEYLGQWLDDHEVEVKPQTMASYRDLVTRYVVPRMGHMRLQGVQPAALTKLYRDLRDTGGVQGRGLSPRPSTTSTPCCARHLMTRCALIRSWPRTRPSVPSALAGWRRALAKSGHGSSF